MNQIRGPSNGFEVTKYEEDVRYIQEMKDVQLPFWGEKIIEGPQLLDLPAMDGI